MLGFFVCVHVFGNFFHFWVFLFGSVFVSIGAFCLVCWGEVWFFKLVFSSVLFILVAVLVFVLLFVYFGGGFNLFLFCFRVCGWFFLFGWFVLLVCFAIFHFFLQEPFRLLGQNQDLGAPCWEGSSGCVCHESTEHHWGLALSPLSLCRCPRARTRTGCRSCTTATPPASTSRNLACPTPPSSSCTLLTRYLHGSTQQGQESFC